MDKPQALIVEDVPDLATVFAEAVDQAGYVVTCLEDGITALLYLSEYVPDLLVLDIHLPHMNGDRVLQLVRQDSRFNNTRVIIVTADDRRSDELRSEVDLVLQKPVSFLQLRDLSSRLTAVMAPESVQTPTDPSLSG